MTSEIWVKRYRTDLPLNLIIGLSLLVSFGITVHLCEGICFCPFCKPLFGENHVESGRDSLLRIGCEKHFCETNEALQLFEVIKVKSALQTIRKVGMRTGGKLNNGKPPGVVTTRTSEQMRRGIR